jgi:hypothetical protein
MDREGDIHEVFAKVLDLGHEAIIRRYRNRAVAEWLLDADQVLRTVPALACVQLKLPPGHGRKARTVVAELRSKVMTLTPNNHVERQRQPLRLTMIEVREIGSTPAGEEPIQWLLWTNEPAQTKRQILVVVHRDVGATSFAHRCRLVGRAPSGCGRTCLGRSDARA